ncbi:MAG: 3-coathanger stack domain-containing protein, partial [Bacteroidota bacterium]
MDNTQMHAVDGIILASNTINPNSDITYQAGTSVTLQAGFTTRPGTDFTAKIGDCPQSGYETDGFVQRSGNNIEYDCEGNRTRDPNKGITVAFNYLNQPYQVTWDNGNRVNWLYDGAGTKLQKQTTGKRLEQFIVNGDTLFQVVDTTLLKLDYLDGSSIEYEQDTIARIYADDARVNFASDTLTNYSYFLKDHLMSTRVVFEEENGAAQLISEHHSYPFGLAFKGDFATNNATKRLYNFKERIGDFGLEWSDFGARHYLGIGGEPVFLTVDPVAENFAHVSAYNYAENKVPNAIDLYGLQAEHFANVWFNARERQEKEAGETAGQAMDKSLQDGGIATLGVASIFVPDPSDVAIGYVATTRFGGKILGGISKAGGKIAGKINSFIDDVFGVVPKGPGAKGSKRVKQIPEVEFDEAEMPGIVENIKNALASGISNILTRQTGRSKIRKNRRAALKGHKKTGTGTSLDEFPFASSKEG